jgi:hypothetical protein
MAETAAYPAIISNKLFQVEARKTTYLTNDITSAQTNFAADTTGFPSEGFVTIENETIYYPSLSALQFGGTCTRGYAGTAVSHTAGTMVRLSVAAATLNRIIAEVIATQTYAGTSGGTHGFVNARYLSGLTTGQIVTASSNATYLGGSTVGEIIAAVPAASAFWTDMPGTPTRVGDTSFTITDTSNANYYDLLFKKGTILQWLEGATFQWGMVITATYAADEVTITMVGDTLDAGFTDMKFCASKAQIETFIIAGVLAALTDTAKTWITPYPICVFSADLNVKVAGTGAGANTVDINDDATTMFTTKPSIAENVTADIDNVSDNVETVVAAGSLITIDVDAITATTAPTDAYVKVYYCPEAWRYQS